MKKLYSFIVNERKVTEEPIVKKNEAGEEIKVLEKIERIVPKTYFIRKPTRNDFDEADFFHDKLFSDNIRAGIITRSEIIKRFANEDVEIKKVYDDYTRKQNELQRLSILEQTEENLVKKNKLQQELFAILIDIQNFEFNKSSVFDKTAENRARTKTIFWWILHLAYKLDGDKESPIFDGKTYEEKIEQYDLLFEKGDQHFAEVMQKLLYFVPGWYGGQLNTEEDFKKAEDLLKAEMLKQKEEENKLKKEEAKEQATE